MLKVSSDKPPSIYAIFDAYSVTSEYQSAPQEGLFTVFDCITTSGMPISLPTPWTTVKPSPEIPNSRFLSQVLPKFQSFLGFSTCQGQGIEVIPTSLINVNGTNAVTDALSAVRTESPVSSTSPKKTRAISRPSPSKSRPKVSLTSSASSTADGPTTQSKTTLNIVIGVIVPILGLALLALGFLLLRRYRRNRRQQTDSRDTPGSDTDPGPFFQPKPELNGEPSRYELHAEDKRVELESKEATQEMPVQESFGLE